MLQWITDWLSSAGYVALLVLMLLENVFPPIPSELIMPLAGFNVARGELGFAGAVLAGTAGSVLGAVVLYGAARRLGRERLERFAARHGRWLTMSAHDVQRASGWFERHGKSAVFFGRLIPAIRSLISLPAGIQRMPFPTFLAFTTLGSLLWTAALTGAGYWLRSSFQDVEKLVSPVSGAIVIGLVAWYAWRVAHHEGESHEAARA